MFASQPAQHATATRIVAGLRAYERHMRELVPAWFDVDLYQTASIELDQIRAWCGTLPQISVPWIGLLIAHADLMQALWTHGPRPVRADPEIQQRLDDLLARVETLARRCELLLPRPTGLMRPAWGC